MTIQAAQLQLNQQLSTVYEAREASNIAHWVLEHLTGMPKVDRLMHRDKLLTATQAELLHRHQEELLKHRPVQYVLGQAWFAGMRFYVNEHVLIPRPETEELVEWIVDDQRAGGTGTVSPQALSVLDVGTGSGCIPIALKKKLPAATLYGCDVSEAALEVAQHNGQSLGAEVQWLRTDFLQATAWPGFPLVDILVSNPPYIPVSDKASMQANVLQYEPHLALFVENDDPLLFYRHIAQFAVEQLAAGGRLYVEIHEDLGPATVQLFTQYGLTNIILRQDLQGRDRMVHASKA